MRREFALLTRSDLVERTDLLLLVETDLLRDDAPADTVAPDRLE